MTKEGEVLFKHIESAVNLITRGENQIREGIGFEGGQIRIGASDTICKYYLIPFINEFHKRFPAVHIKVMNGTSLQCVDYLQSNQVDLIIVNYPNNSLSAVCKVKEIREFKDVFIVNKNCFKVEDKTYSLKEILEYPILMLEKNSTTSEFLHTLFLQHSLELVPEIELSSNDMLIELAKIGMGVAFVPDYCVRNEDIHIAKLNINEVQNRKLVVAYNSQVELTPITEYFMKLLC